MSDSIKSADRRLKLLLLLQSSKQLSVNKIADYFNISRRTVFRDLRALQDLEVPIVHDSVEGYSLIKGYKVPPLMFSERELASIVLGLSFMKSQLDGSMRDDAKQVMLKIKSVLSSNLLEFILSIEEHVIAEPYKHELNSTGKLGDWFSICSAISERSRIQFMYKSEKGETLRTIDPYFIVLYQDHWNVIGYDHDRKGRRNFKLDQLSELKRMAERFEPIDLNRKNEFIYNINQQEIKEFELSVKSESINLFLRQFPGLVNTLEHKGDYYSVGFQFDNIDWLVEFCIKFIDQIKIESKDLKDRVKLKLGLYMNSL